MLSTTNVTGGLPRPSTIGGAEWSRRLAQKRRASRELSALIVKLDGGKIDLPATDKRAS